MDENILRFRVGMFVVLAMCILGVLIFINSEGWSSQYIVYAKPTSAPGVTAGTPIRKNGILIGRVKDVSTEDDHVLLTLGINEGENIYANEVASIGSESLLGDAVVKFLTKPPAERGNIIGNDHNVATVEIERNPMDLFADLQPKVEETLDALKKAGSSVDEAGDGIKELAGSIQNVFDDEDSEVKALLTELRGTAVKAQVALDNFDRIFENVNNVIGDPELKSQIKGALTEVPKMFEQGRLAIQDGRLAIADVRKAVKSFGSIPDNINATTENVRIFTETLKDEGPKVLLQVNSSLQGIDELVMDVRTFTKTLSSLKNSDSSIAKLFNDTTLFDEIKETVFRLKESSKNVQRVTTKLEPLMDDARGFADQINRNPSVLGVGGALDGRKQRNAYKGSAGKANFFMK
ncbi:MAG: MlaD family protein [Mariniblastus sp.]